MTETTLTIARRFCGPPQSGNGGYVAGLLARAMQQPCQVTLHAPPPLDTPLRLETLEDQTRLYQGQTLLASAIPYSLQMAIAQPPTLSTALAAQERFEGFRQHGLPGCFVCGTQREAPDGMRIFAGPIEQEGKVAAVWTPDASLDAGDGRVASEFVWAALDCPGFFAVREQAGTALLGRFAASLLEPVVVGEPLIVSGWAVQHDGRKHHAGTALHREDGTPVACAIAIWISLKQG